MAKKKTGFDPTQVVTIDKDEVLEIKDEKEDMAQALKNSELTKKVLCGRLATIEPLRISDSETITVGVVNFHGNRVIIPLNEMNIQVKEDADANVKRQKILSNMIGCEIDFVVEAYDAENNSTVGSRKKAMEKKAREFYVDINEKTGQPIIAPGAIAEARVVAVTETFVRIEVFGTECFVPYRDMRQLWTANARTVFHVGDKTPVVIKTVEVKDGSVKITAEAKSLYPAPTVECVKNGKYLGTVTGISRSKDGGGTIYFLCLDIGVNAISYSCEYGYPLPRKNDQVAFACTRFDKKEPLAAGIITRLVRQAD